MMRQAKQIIHKIDQGIRHLLGDRPSPRYSLGVEDTDTIQEAERKMIENYFGEQRSMVSSFSLGVYLKTRHFMATMIKAPLRLPKKGVHHGQ